MSIPGTPTPNTPVSNEQHNRLVNLRARYATAADAVREYARLIDIVEAARHQFSEQAHADASGLLRLRQQQAIRAQDSARDALHNAEGFLSCRT